MLYLCQTFLWNNNILREYKSYPKEKTLFVPIGNQNLLNLPLWNKRGRFSRISCGYKLQIWLTLIGYDPKMEISDSIQDESMCI